MKKLDEWDELAYEAMGYVNRDKSLFEKTHHTFQIKDRILILDWINHKWEYRWSVPTFLDIDFVMDMVDLGYGRIQ